MSILITGANGFLGKNLAYAAENFTDEHVIKVCRSGNGDVFDGDLSDPHYVAALMKEFNPDQIWHLAAKSTIKPDEDNPTKIIDDNIKTTLNLCTYAPEGCFIKFASSIVVYGDSYGKHAEEGSLCKPTSIYAITKLASEEIVRVYHNSGKIRGINLRMSAVIGPHLTHGIVRDFIRKLKSSSITLDVLGSEPGADKPFCHVSDVVAAFLKNDYPENLTTMNVCPDDSITVDVVARTVMQALDIKKPIRWLGKNSTWFGDNKALLASNTLYNQLVGFPLSSTSAVRIATLENKDIT